MATPAQIIANKANSQKSTGPVTEEGKAKSSRNRLSHGFAASIRLIEGEDPEQFKGLIASLMREYQPATPTEQIFVEMMAHNRWISLRATRLQDNLINTMSVLDDLTRTLPLLIRYKTTADRAFFQAHTELLNARKQAPNREIGFESQSAQDPSGVAPESPAPAPKPPATPPQKEKPVSPAAPKVTSVSDFAPSDEVMERLRTASVEEFRASGR